MAGLSAAPALRLQRWLLSQWFRPRPSWPARFAIPLAALYGVLADRRRRQQLRDAAAGPSLGRPLVVVGNLVLGGAGKTPTTIALVQALRAAGWRPGVVSRGHGREGDQVVEVTPDLDAAQAGDEPLLIARRTDAPLFVGRDRVAAAHALCDRHPEVDIVVADDGLQHRRLPRDVEVVVFDDRGVGNGLLLPAGPLREPLGAAPGPRTMVLYTEGRRSTAWPGHLGLRTLGDAWPLADWWRRAGTPAPLAQLRGRRLTAMAALAVPERFFAALEAQGLSIERLPLPDHHRYEQAPWPAGTAEIVTTEKDAVKLRRWADGGPRIWVVALDLSLPAAFVAELTARLAPPARP